MAFEDLTEEQKQLVARLVENLASGDFSSEFFALATLGRGWFVQLNGQGGAESTQLDGFTETDLRALESEGYITLMSKRNHYSASLKPKAYSEYRASRTVTIPTRPGGAVAGGTETQSVVSPDESESQPEASTAAFDADHFEQIERKSLELISDLSENYRLSRDQARSWGFWTIVVSVLGFALIAVGVILVFQEVVAVGTLSSVAGLVAEFIATRFAKQASTANARQDTYHEQLITRQRILDAVQVVGLLTDESDRNRMVESIVRELLGISDASRDEQS
jgi:hypothetical protein